MFPKFLCRFFPLTVSEENGLTEVEENDSEDTHEWDDYAHKVVVCNQSRFSGGNT